jgi:DNA-directed RNA polymerase subunit RPC12/RpoP
VAEGLIIRCVRCSRTPEEAGDAIQVVYTCSICVRSLDDDEEGEDVRALRDAPR